MLAVAWTAIGMLAATLVTTLYWLGTRIDHLSARIEAHSSSLSARIDALDERLSARIDAQTARIDALTDAFREHVQRHAG